MTETELKFRLKQFALRVIRLVDEMPHSVSSKALASQIMRSGTSPYSNYCAACIAKSDKDFLNKLKMVAMSLINRSSSAWSWATRNGDCPISK